MSNKTHHYCYSCKRKIESGFEKKAHERLGHDVDQVSQEYYEAEEEALQNNFD